MAQQVYSVSEPFLLRVSMGLEPKWSLIEKFGENPNVDTADVPEDLWGFGGLYQFSTAADIDTISSSDAGDTQDITIIGQTLDGTEIEQSATLSGQNKVALTTPLWRIYRAYNAGSSDISGTVYIYKDGTVTAGVPDTDADVRAVIVDGDNQTEMGIYTIPKDKCGYFLGGYVSISRTGVVSNSEFTWRLRNPGSVFRVQSRIACIGQGNSSWDYHYPAPVGPIPEMSDIVLTVNNVGSNDTGCAGGFTILLQDIS